VSDRLDGRFAPFRATARRPARAAAWALVLVAVAACHPLNPAQLPPEGDGGTPCTLAEAVAFDTVVIAAGACNPWCIRVAAGSPIYFVNQDQAYYLFMADPPLPYDVQVPGRSPAVTLPLPAGTWTFTAVQAPAATVTVFVE
jgi:hypothetical protein